jgi:hypothetical protein
MSELNIDYNKEYEDLKRCRNCNRRTDGEQDFINQKNNKRTKTCKKCRLSVIKSLQKRITDGKTEKKLTQKEKITHLTNILKNNINDDFHFTDIEKKLWEKINNNS